MEKLVVLEGGVPGIPRCLERVFGSFESTESGFRVPGRLNLRFHRPERPLRDFRLSFRLSGEEGGSVIFQADGYEFVVSSPADPVTRVVLDQVTVAATARPGPGRGEAREVVYERDGGTLAVFVDGREILSASDPRPGTAISFFEIFCPGPCLVENLRLEGCAADVPGTHLSPRRDLPLDVCIDFNDDLIRNAWTERTFREAMAFYRGRGMRRVYFIYHYGYRGGFWVRNERHERTREAVGEFLPATVRFAREAGLECFAVLKPFEPGLYPGRLSDEKFNAYRLERLGTQMYRVTRFLAENPGFRIERRMDDVPADIADRRVKTLVFRAEEGTGGNFNPASLRLWTSPDNSAYRPYDGPLSVRRENGGEVLVLDGLEPGDRFLAVTAGEKPGYRFGNRLDRLVEARDESGVLPLAWGEKLSDRRGSFPGTGFVFDNSSRPMHSADRYTWLDGGRPLGLVPGRERYLPAAMCLSYPEVRAWWLEKMEECLAAGVDGVDFRVVNHNWTYDWPAFGFNAPVREAFLERHGVDILNEPFDYAHLRRLRGEYYTMLLRQARARLREAGKAMQVHVSGRMRDPEWHTEMEMHFDWETWIREGLADAITLKMSPARGGICPAVISLAREAGLPVYACPYINGLKLPDGPDTAAYMRRDATDAGVDGLIIYENAAFMGARDDGGIEITKPWLFDTLGGS